MFSRKAAYQSKNLEPEKNKNIIVFSRELHNQKHD